MSSLSEWRHLPAPSTLSLGGLSPDTIVRGHRDQPRPGTDFWASARRPITSEVDEVLEIEFGAIRRVNLISFQVSRFPCSVRAEYLDENGNWHPFVYPANPRSRQTPLRHVAQPVPIETLIGDSVPRIVDRASSPGHPQHYGDAHWQTETWQTEPARAAKIRFLLRRDPSGQGPTSPSGLAADYSLALAQIQVGYRIVTEDDIPGRLEDVETFESITDLIGSRVDVSTYRQQPEKAIDGDLATFWQCAPQPVNYAVVPLYLDVRDPDGRSQVIDRFFVDPVTPGVHCNLYYSDEHPTGDFEGEQQDVPLEMTLTTGSPRFGSTSGFPLGRGEPIVLGHDNQVSSITVPDRFLRMRPKDPWWIGLDLEARETAATGEERTLLHLGKQRLMITNSEVVLAETDTGERVGVPVAPQHTSGVNFRVTLAFYPETTERASYVRLTYSAPEYFYEASEEMVREIVPNPETDLTIGSSHDRETFATVAVKGLVVKYEMLTPEAERWFLDEGEDFVIDDLTYVSPRRANANAILRMHSAWASIPANPFGIVGGGSGRMSENIWHPVNRDFVLQRGFMEFPAVKAKYWKLEFTNLTPQIYETFHTINREVMVFPDQLVQEYSQTGPQKTRNYTPHGTRTMVNGLADELTYHDALTGLRNSRFLTASPEATSALVVRSPELAQQVAQSGWIWQYQPWHADTGAPRWPRSGKHQYEVIPVEHRSKVAYFVGIREISPYRVNYRAQDDTPEYVDRFLDDLMIEESNGLELNGHGVICESTFGTLTSRTFESYQNVRAVQFATVQTGPVQALADPFSDSWQYYYLPYGDASPVVENGRMTVRRSYVTGGPQEEPDPGPFNPIFPVDIPKSLDDLTYREMEAFTYGQLEGLFVSGDPDSPIPGGGGPGTPGVTKHAEGGVAMLGSYVPLGNGEITARARVSTDSPLAYPIALDIVAGRDGNGTILASSRDRIAPGSITELETTFSPQTLTDTNTHTWGDLEKQDTIGGDYPEEADPNRAGRGSPNPQQPTSMWPHSVADFTHDSAEPGTHGWRYFSLIPTRDTQVSLDTFLSERTPEDATTADRVLVEVVSGMENATYTEAAGKQRVVGDVFMGEEVLWRVMVQDNTDDEFTHDVKVRLSDYGSMELWPLDPWAPDPDADALYGALEAFTYGELERRTNEVEVPELSVRVRQQGASYDSFHIHDLGLYDDPVHWLFSVDDGETWFGAPSVRNNPHGVVTFPVPGNRLRWKAEISREDAAISALYVRPWYGSRGKTAEPSHDLVIEGPNEALWDHYPSVEQHPVFRTPVTPVDVYDPSRLRGRPNVLGPIGPRRNLVSNPSAELDTETWDEGYETLGGTLRQEGGED